MLREALRRSGSARHFSGMQRSLRRSALLAVCIAAAAALASCATQAASEPASDGPPGAALGSTRPGVPEGDVVAQGTVLAAGGAAQLCLGAIAESYPPQCTGIPLESWSWEGVDGAETSGDVTWGAYALQGTYDGDVFAVTQPPVMLALYDPMPVEDPTGGEPGTTDEQTLLQVQEQLPELLGSAYLASYPQDGRLWVDVVWDDGTWQNAADQDYGKGVVVIRSAMRAVGG
jgi:hypothetical protein